MFQLVDSLNKIHLRPETRNKLKKVREDIDKTIKEEAEKEQKEEVCCSFFSVVASVPHIT